MKKLTAGLGSFFRESTPSLSLTTIHQSDIDKLNSEINSLKKDLYDVQIQRDQLEMERNSLLTIVENISMEKK